MTRNQAQPAGGDSANQAYMNLHPSVKKRVQTRFQPNFKEGDKDELTDDELFE